MGEQNDYASKSQHGTSADSTTNKPDECSNWSDHHQELWLDRFAQYLGFGRLGSVLNFPLPPSYLYAVVTVVGWAVLSTSIDLFYFETEPIYVRNPYFLLQPLILLVGVYGAHSLRRSYEAALKEMKLHERTDDIDQFQELFPSWLPWLLFGTAATLQLSRSYADLGTFTPTGFVANAIIFPFVYAPILVQFLTIYVGIEFVAPWRLYKSDVGIHFLDPHGVGGLRPFGELVKKAYYFIVAGLIAYAFLIYAPGLAVASVSATAAAIFTGVWAASIATVAFAVFVLHRFLHREKREELEHLEKELRNYIENPWEVSEYTIPEDATQRVEDIQERIDTVSATREYPATFNIWTQLLLSIAIPKAVQLFLASI